MHTNYSSHGYSSSGGGSHAPRAHVPPPPPPPRLVRSNSDWNQTQQRTSAQNDAYTRMQQHYGRTPTTAEVRNETNRIYGARYESHVERALARHPRYSNIQDQVRLVPNPQSGRPFGSDELRQLGRESGSTIRSDLLTYDHGAREYHNFEAKSSNTASYSANQRQMLEQIDREGATVVSDRGSYRKGTNLGFVGTTTVRPSNENSVFTYDANNPLRR